MITVGALEADDCPAWETLFAGYHEFYGRRTWPRESYDLVTPRPVQYSCRPVGLLVAAVVDSDPGASDP